MALTNEYVSLSREPAQDVVTIAAQNFLFKIQPSLEAQQS